MRRRSTLLMMLAAIVLIAIASFPTAEVQAAKKTYLSIASGNPLGGFYPLAGAIAELITSQLPDVDASAQVTAASNENLRLLAKGSVELALLNSSVVYDYVDGKLQRVSYPGIRTIMSSGYSDATVMTLKSKGIKTFADLKGKKVSVGQPGSGTEAMARHVFAAHGMSFNDFKPMFLSHTEGVEALKDGRIDAVFFSITGRPAANVMEVATTHAIVLLPWDPAARDKFIRDYGYMVKRTIPAGLYRGVDQPVDVMGPFSALCVRADLPDDLVYKITKLIYENLPKLQKSNPTFGEWELTREIEGLYPLHPGAERFYKELGK